MTMIYIIRHAEAEGNAEMRVNGHTDSNLTAVGRRQLTALQERFGDVTVDAVYSSDLSRARDTAMALAEPRGLTAVQLAELREQHFGDWEGQPFDTTRSDEEWGRPPNGENYTALQSRVMMIMEEIARRHSNQTVAVVSHGITIRAWQCHLLGVPFAEMWTSDRLASPYKNTNTGVTCVACRDGVFSVRYLDDTAHLETLF